MFKLIIFAALIIETSVYMGVWIKDIIGNKVAPCKIVPIAMVAGITNFFDALGIGSFAPSLSLISTFKLSEEKKLPGTLNVGLTIPVVAEAFIFIGEIKVDEITLVALIASATLGGVLGAMFISSLNESVMRKLVGVSLISMAAIMILGQTNIFSFGGTLIGLRDFKLVIAIICNFILGSLMTAGVGLYAPCMFMVIALGMDARVAFPIMMGSCAFLMPAASIKFIKGETYDRGSSLIISIFGVLGVILGSKIVTTLSVEFIKYIVILVVMYGGISSLRRVRHSNSGRPRKTQGSGPWGLM